MRIQRYAHAEAPLSAVAYSIPRHEPRGTGYAHAEAPLSAHAEACAYRGKRGVDAREKARAIQRIWGYLGRQAALGQTASLACRDEAVRLIPA
jgi:hypothetical protein